jgi:hypothetical protein
MNTVKDIRAQIARNTATMREMSECIEGFEADPNYVPPTRDEVVEMLRGHLWTMMGFNRLLEINADMFDGEDE